MSKVNWLAGIACMASATVAGAKDVTQSTTPEQQSERKALIAQAHAQTTKMDLLVEVLKTRLS